MLVDVKYIYINNGTMFQHNGLCISSFKRNTYT